jgi:hypothetical protein
MKQHNLVTDKNLGEVISSCEHHHPELAAKPDHAKPDKLEKIDKPARRNGSHVESRHRPFSASESDLTSVCS